MFGARSMQKFAWLALLINRFPVMGRLARKDFRHNLCLLRTGSLQFSLPDSYNMRQYYNITYFIKETAVSVHEALSGKL